MSTPVTEQPQRHYPVPGLYNLRDTGGYQAVTGSSAWGRLFRSDALHRIDDAGRGQLADLGIAHVIDLRGVAEAAAAPSALGGVAVTIHHLPVFDDADPAAQPAAGLGLAEVYDHIVDSRGDRIVAALRVIAAADDGDAVLVHCTAGKDRTGLVVAFALLAAGVERDEVVADYALTASYLAGEWAEGMLAAMAERGVEVTPERRELVSASPASLMAALLDRIETEYGSIPEYLMTQGLTEVELDRLAARLLS